MCVVEVLSSIVYLLRSIYEDNNNGGGWKVVFSCHRICKFFSETFDFCHSDHHPSDLFGPTPYPCRTPVRISFPFQLNGYLYCPILYLLSFYYGTKTELVSLWFLPPLLPKPNQLGLSSRTLFLNLRPASKPSSRVPRPHSLSFYLPFFGYFLHSSDTCWSESEWTPGVPLTHLVRSLYGETFYPLILRMAGRGWGNRLLQGPRNWEEGGTERTGVKSVIPEGTEPSFGVPSFHFSTTPPSSPCENHILVDGVDVLLVSDHLLLRFSTNDVPLSSPKVPTPPPV